jgi:hypothetical protein
MGKVKQRDAEQGQRKQDEIKWNTEEDNWIGQCGLDVLDIMPNFLSAIQ